MQAAVHLSGDEADEREDLLQLLYLCPVALVRLDAHGKIVLMNPHGTQLLMTLSSDGNLENLFDVFRPFAPEVREMAIRFVPRAGKICEEHRIVVPLPGRPANAPIIVSLTLQKIDEDIYVAVMADITATATRELNIRRSEERLHAVLDSVQEYAICTLDPGGIITSWNRAAERLDDYRSDEVMGRHIDMLGSTNGVASSPFKKRLQIALREGSSEFETWRVRKDGSRYWASCAVSCLNKKDDQTLLGFSVVTRDMTERRRAEDNLRLLASTDPLTGAMNRRAFFEAAAREEARATRSDESLAVLLIDVDHFKAVNDSHGHEAGDVVLQRLVVECRNQIRTSDLLGRLGGEEFGIVLTGGKSGGSSVAIAERIRACIAETAIAVGSKTLSISISVGLCERTGSEVNVDRMIRAADAALFAAKREGRNRVVVSPP